MNWRDCLQIACEVATIIGLAVAAFGACCAWHAQQAVTAVRQAVNLLQTQRQSQNINH